MRKALLLLVLLPLLIRAQVNTDHMMRMGRNSLFYAEYVLSIRYFNQVIAAKPFLSEPYYYRAVAKFYLEDYWGAEADCSASIERNPFITNVYQLRGLCRIKLGRFADAVADYDRALEDAIWRSLVCIVLNNDYSFQDGMEIRVYPDRLEFAFKAVSARIERSKGNWYLSGVSTNGQLQDTFYKTHPDETGHLSSITEYMKGGPAAIAINENDFSVITLKLPEDANLTIEDTQNSSDKENDKENIPANLERNVKNSHAAADSSDNDNLKSDYNPLDYISSRNANDNVKNSLDKEGDNEKFGENLIPDGVILSDKEKRVFEVIAENPYLTRNEIMERTSIPPATLSRAVKHLKDLKLVNRVGSDKNGYWEITAGSSKPLHK